MSTKKISIIAVSAAISITAIVFAVIWATQTSPAPYYSPVFALDEPDEEIAPPPIQEIEPEPEPEPPIVHTATLAFVGDLMCHQEQLDAARVSPGVYDFNYAFQFVKHYFDKADLAIGNLETTIVTSGFRYAGWPLFRSPFSFAEAIKNAGITFLTLGNNHIFDAGAEGLYQTVAALDALGIGHTGTFLTYDQRDETTIVEVNGITFALLSYTYSTNAISLDANGNMLLDRTVWDRGERNYMVKYIYHDRTAQSIIDYELIAADIARARALNPDFVVVLPHIGLEYYGTMNDRRDTFDAATDVRWYNWMRTINFMLEAGADIVMSSHPHVLLPAEFVYVTDEDGTVRRTFVAHSMANFVSAQRTNPRDMSAIFYLNFEKVEGERAIITSAKYAPILVQGRSFTVLPVTDTLQRVAEGNRDDLRDADIARLRRAQLDVTHMLSGEPIPEEDMQVLYEITRERTINVMPGRKIWGDLPWR
ncbi:MAG: CapA family protein [Defluviitaleaceae bacterium]|nr:CapA family protein [Defluviitaleaceae bacterium]